MPNSLVTVDERVIHDQGEAKGCRLPSDGWVQILAAERLPRLPQGGFQHAEIPQRLGSTRLGDDPTMELENLSEAEVASHRRRS